MATVSERPRIINRVDMQARAGVEANRAMLDRQDNALKSLEIRLSVLEPAMWQTAKQDTKGIVDDDMFRAICELRDEIVRLTHTIAFANQMYKPPSPDPPSSLKDWWELLQPLRRSDCACIGELVRVSWEAHEWDCPRHGHVTTRQFYTRQ